MQRVSKFNRRFAGPAVALGLLISAIVPVANAETHVVEMLKYKFVPEEITIKAGDTVHWVNVERRAYHTIWFKEQGEKETAELFPKEFFEKTFDKPGDYPYLCGPHWEQRDMKGVVHVLP
jgi:plastocyanin